MPKPTISDLGSQIRQWITENRKEGSRLEFKKRIEFIAPGAKAEFIRDVLSLANSEGETPRRDGHLVIGFRDGKRHDIRDEHYDGATFGQILDAFISPHVSTSYEEFPNGGRGRVGVLIVKPDPSVLYVVRKKLLDEQSVAQLQAGQSWGRKSDRKIELDGDAIHARITAISERMLERAAKPLKQRIERLEQESGAALEVKRIRFAIEDTQDAAKLESLLQQLLPYASEFDHHVKDEVLQAVSRVTDRTRYSIGVDLIRAADAVLGQLMPLGSSHHPRPSKPSTEEVEIIKGLGNLAFDMTWDACRYVRETPIVEIGARRYWVLIRFAALNRLGSLKRVFVKEARRCQEMCNEERKGVGFSEGWKILDDTIRDALDLSASAKRK